MLFKKTRGAVGDADGGKLVQLGQGKSTKEGSARVAKRVGEEP